MLLAWWGHEPYPIDGHKEAWFPCVCVCDCGRVYIFFFWGNLDIYFIFFYFFCVFFAWFGTGLVPGAKRFTRAQGPMTEWDM